jgi:tRNA-modifying protein YgfZ
MSDDALRCRVLSDRALIDVGGDDGTAFLHGQLGVDVLKLTSERAPLAAWHDPKGRVRALFRIFRGATVSRLMLPRAIRNGVVAKLGLYVLRADVRIVDRDDLIAAAICGDADAWLAAREVALGAARDDALAAGDSLHWVRLGPELIHLTGVRDEVESMIAGIEPASADAVELAEIRLGIPAIGAGLEEEFLPQMLNLDVLGSMSFDKGCYPGQEVIARIHHLGAVKRRMRRFAVAHGALAAGDVLTAPDGSAAGRVIRAADAGEGRECLAVVKLHALEAGFELRTPAGAPVAELPPP